jgi:hypothetical protein
VGYSLDGLWLSLDDGPKLPPTPGWKLAGFASEADAEAFKARQRAQYGRAVSFPWDGYSG